MRRYLFLLAAGLCGAGLVPCHGSPTAQARLFCWSVRFQQGTYYYGWYTLDLTTFQPQTAPPNGELGPLFGSFTHWSYFLMKDHIFDETLPGLMNLNVPMADADGDGFPDFFDVSRNVSGTTTGGYQDFMGGHGTVSAVWSRAAGSKRGTCVLTLRDSYLGPLGSFTHAFEIFDYAGPLTYTPASNTVPATLDVSEIAEPANYFRGPMVFTKSATNRFNLLTLEPTVLTNAAAQTLTVLSNLFYRDPDWPTNYYGYLEFEDGDLNTAGEDYYLWTLSIDDPNDADQDGIPDFSDDPVGLPRRPVLSLTVGTTNLWLKISGDVGRLYDIQSVTNVASTNWQLVASLTLTNDPQRVSLAKPAAPRFWRVRVR